MSSQAVTISSATWLWIAICFSVAIYKRHYLLALVGVTFFPVLLLAAIRLAKPNSWWARRFYGPERLARAEARHGFLDPGEPPKGLGFPGSEQPRWPERGRWSVLA